MARVILAMLILCLSPMAMWAQNAASILAKAADAYERSNGIEASFVMSTRSAANGSSDSVEGKIQIRGDKFTLETPDMYTWFDGTTQWSYVERNEEVNVTNPSGEELQFTNPILLLKNYKRGFTAAYLGESTASKGKSVYDVELTPKKRGDIVKVVLRIEKFSSLPASISVTSKNGLTSKIDIKSIKSGMRQPDSMFRFNPDAYPDAEVIDLR